MFVRDYIKEKNITEAQYAMMAHLQLSDRMPKYLRDQGKAEGVKAAAISLYDQNPELFENTKNELTILKRTGTVEILKPLLTNLFIMIVLFMVLLSLILTQSLV